MLTFLKKIQIQGRDSPIIQAFSKTIKQLVDPCAGLKERTFIHFVITATIELRFRREQSNTLIHENMCKRSLGMKTKTASVKCLEIKINPFFGFLFGLNVVPLSPLLSRAERMSQNSCESDNYSFLKSGFQGVSMLISLD